MTRGTESNGGDRRTRWLILLILGFAFVFRLGWCLTRSNDLAALPDQLEYQSLAQSLLRAGRLAFVDPRFRDTVYAFRMPGYPAFVAMFGANVTLVRVAQALIDTSTVLATIWLARRWLSPRLACIAGLIVAIDPIFVYFSGLILSETLFVALLTWGITCLAHGDSPLARSHAWPFRAAWWAGVALLIASIYVRPAAIVLPVILVAGAAIVEVVSPAFVPARRRWPVLTIVAFLTLAALLPWAARNRALLGRWIFTTTNDGFTLYDGWQPSADGSSNLAVLDELPLLANLSEVQRSDYLRRAAIDSAKNDPWRIVRLVPIKLARLWSPVPLSAEYGSRKLYVIAAALHAVPMMVLAAFAALASPALSRRAKVFLLLPAIVTTITYGLTVGSLRYRMPVHPTLAVLAACAFVRRRD